MKKLIHFFRKSSPEEDAAEKDPLIVVFKAAAYGRYCRTRAFKPGLSKNSTEYMKAVAVKAADQWDVIKVTEKQTPLTGRDDIEIVPISQTKVLKLSLSFFDAIKELALYENTHETLKLEPVAAPPAADDFNDFRNFAMREGIAFDVEGYPVPTFEGEIVTDARVSVTMEKAVKDSALQKREDMTSGAVIEQFFVGMPPASLRVDHLEALWEQQDQIGKFLHYLKSFRLFTHMMMECDFDFALFDKEQFLNGTYFAGNEWDSDFVPDEGRGIEKGITTDSFEQVDNFLKELTPVLSDALRQEGRQIVHNLHAFYLLAKKQHLEGQLNQCAPDGGARIRLKQAANKVISKINKIQSEANIDMAALSAEIPETGKIKRLPRALRDEINGWEKRTRNYDASPLKGFVHYLLSFERFVKDISACGFDEYRFNLDKFCEEMRFKSWHWPMADLLTEGESREVLNPDFIKEQSVNALYLISRFDFLNEEQRLSAGQSVAFMSGFYSLSQARNAAAKIQENPCPEEEERQNFVEMCRATIDEVMETHDLQSSSVLEAFIFNTDKEATMPAAFDDFIKSWEDLYADATQKVERVWKSPETKTIGAQPPRQLNP